RLARALRSPGRIDAVTVEHLEMATATLVRSYQDVRPAAMLGLATGHLETITSLLSEAPGPLRARLCTMAVEIAGLLGWLRWILDDQPVAQSYFRVGLEAAREANDRDLGSYLVGCAACRPFYREDPRERLSWLDSSPYGFAAAGAGAPTQ